MRVIFGLGKDRIKKNYNSVVTIGVFDGLHRGHLKLLKETLRYARRLKGKSIVITFHPHPQKESSLYSLKHRLRLLDKLGIDICIVLKFTKYFSRISAEEFVKDLIIKIIYPNYIIVGENFHFGRSARGTPLILKRFAKTQGFKLKVIPVVKFKSKVVSSTYIRRLITEGRLKEAERVLSRPVTILGTVVRGTRLGRLLGFPTANIYPHHEVLPPSGVYIARAYLKNKTLKGLCYIGTRPTLGRPKDKNAHTHIEMHIFNFDQKLYGRELEIQFLKKIRGDKKFDSLQLLRCQIKKDVGLAEDFLNRLKSLHN